VNLLILFKLPLGYYFKLYGRRADAVFYLSLMMMD